MSISEFKTDFLYSKEGQYLIDPFLKQFALVIRNYTRFHMLFFFIGFVEIFLFLFLFPFLAHSALLAVTFAAIFLTGFTFLTLRLYYQAQKPEQLNLLLQSYISEFKKHSTYTHQAEQHVALAKACTRLAEAFQGMEYEYYPSPHWLQSLRPFCEKFSCWWHWHDVHLMKEMLLSAAVDEHIKMVKSEPTNLEFHAALANAYVVLSGLYIDPRKMEMDEDVRWIPSGYFSTSFDKKFKITAKKAIEEFKILSEYAPHDPWVHTQLAYSYHDLKMPEEETKEYETVLKLKPGDKETLFKLGVLYFQQGRNALGLQIYEELKRIDTIKADDLIQYYAKSDEG